MDLDKTKKILKKAVLPALAIIFAVAFYFMGMGGNHAEGPKTYVEIDGEKVEVELAQTPEDKIKGLSGRSSLTDGTGMLFTFEEKGQLSFWMKDMQFGLDFIWIADDTVVDVHKNIPAPGKGQAQLDIYSPRVPADKVLEVNAGWIENNFGNTDLRGKKIKIYTATQ